MLNSVSLQGRFVGNPELRHSSNGVPVTTFTIAVQRSYVKKGEDRNTDFIDVVAWRNTAEFIVSHFKKGQMAIINGSIQTRTYVTDDGSNRKSTEVIANDIFFCEKKEQSQQTDEDDDWLND